MPVYRDDWVKILTTDGKTFTVPPDILRHSITIYKQMQTAYVTGEELEQPIPIEDCTAEVFQQILIFMQYHRYDPVLREFKDSEDKIISNWDKEFLKNNKHIPISELIGAAYALQVYRLIDVGCIAIARSIEKDASKAQIQSIMSLENAQMSEEEKRNRLRDALMPFSPSK